MKPSIPLICLLGLAAVACSKGKPKERAEPAQEETQPQPVQRARVANHAHETLVLEQVLLESSESNERYRLDARPLAKRLGGVLVSSGWMAARAGDVPDDRIPRRVEATLNINHHVIDPRDEREGSAMVALEATLQYLDGPPDVEPRAAVIVEHALEAGGEAKVKELLHTLSDAALQSVAESLVSRVRLRQASHAELLSALSVGIEEPSLMIWALQLAAERELSEAVPAAIDALESPDENLRGAAIGVLVRLGDASAVPALTRAVNFKDHLELAVAMEAVTAIGGQDALDFLEFVASGHPDAEVRTTASENLQRLRSRALSASGARAKAVN